MSHVGIVEDVWVTDLDMLERILLPLGLELVRDQKTYAWWGRSQGDYPLPIGMSADDLGKCDHAIRVIGKPGKTGVGGPWEIGLVARTDGNPGWMLLYDNYGSHGWALESKGGKGMSKIRRELAREVLESEYLSMGYQVSTTLDEETSEYIVEGWRS